MAYSLYSAIPKKPLNSIFISSPNFIFSTVNKHIPCVTPSIFPCLGGYCTWVSAVSSSVAETEEHLNRHASPGIVAKEYADLNLPERFSEDVGNLRIRQHVNPLRRGLMIPAEAPNWKEVFEDATLPLMVDIGSGSGRFLMWLAKRNSSSMNYLGLEIRPKLVTRAEYWINDLGLKNAHFISTNAMVSFQRLVSTYPGPLMLVSILCPDPHFKKKHHKRRVLQKPLVDSIVNNLAHGGQVFIQSDVLDVALDMRNYFDAVPDKLVHIDSVDPSLPCDGDGWVLNNPMGIRTEREIHAEYEGCKIYRRVYKKVQH
ncbi:hypothetical protein H5410_012495 [Solanum commersonii]|uniref:tRNA (guanine(46)-N(7))-methyltransferase n=4 Tax=Solanum TaxID=4107 RepID=M1D2P4_SOLTU|nr:PREDICTED: tRNA (guanine-N(7)-)-methyltransferase [Solanum tuberosum]KAG5627277.1 hypothetical protein H5410_012495 [Solanum commersonii]KAH0726207.1 hypothetical protein KY284_002072 [Solanum tuberosum]KAH0768079.1 hypothetical protein KY285_003950 [Solanum tuberosum]